MRRAEFTPPPRPTEWGQAYRIQFWSSVAPARWYEPARPKLNSVSLTPGPKPSTEPMTAATARKKCRNPVWCWCPAVVIPRFPTKNTGTCGPRQAETSAKWASSPPRCSPAWSGVQHQRRPRNRPLRHHAARQRGAVFKMLDAVVGRSLVLNMAPRWQAAWWPKTKTSRGGTTLGAKHGSTLASSVVAEDEDVAGQANGWC